MEGYTQVSPAEAREWMVDNPMGEAVHGDTWIRFNPEIQQYEEKYHFNPLSLWEPMDECFDLSFRYYIPTVKINA